MINDEQKISNIERMCLLLHPNATANHKEHLEQTIVEQIHVYELHDIVN